MSVPTYEVSAMTKDELLDNFKCHIQANENLVMQFLRKHWLTAFNVTGVLGITGTPVTIATSTVGVGSVYKTRKQRENLKDLGTQSTCICNECNGIIEYISRHKLTKRQFNTIAGLIPLTEFLNISGQVVKGAYKMKKGTKGVHRNRVSALLWLSARGELIGGSGGCPTAKAIIAVLFGGEKSMQKICDNFRLTELFWYFIGIIERLYAI